MNAVVHGPASDPAANSMPRFIRQLSEPAYNPNADPVSAPSAAGKDDQRGDGGGDGGELAGANEHKQHVVMDAGEPSCLAIIGDTLARNRCLTCVTVCLWPMLALAIVKGIELHACNTRHRVCTDVSGLPFFILTGIFGYIYLLSFVCCAGVCCLSQCCMGGPCIGDYVRYVDAGVVVIFAALVTVIRARVTIVAVALARYPSVMFAFASFTFCCSHPIPFQPTTADPRFHV